MKLNLLVYAAFQDEANVVETIIKCGLNINPPEKVLGASMINAICNSHMATLYLLGLFVHYGANVNYRSDKGKTPLMMAVHCQRETIVEYLIKKGAKVNILDRQDHSPLSLAVKYKNEHIVKLLIDAGADVTLNTSGLYSSMIKQPLDCAIYNQDLNLLKLFITKGADIVYALHYAAIYGNLEIIEELINTRAKDNLNNIGNVSDYCRAWQGNYTPIVYAAILDRTEIVQALINYGAKIDPLILYYIFENIYGEDNLPLRTMNLLIDNGAEADAVNDQGNTLLFTVVDEAFAELEEKYLPIIQLLIERGADVNRQNPKTGDTPLHLACAMFNLSAVELLLKAGAKG